MIAEQVQIAEYSLAGGFRVKGLHSFQSVRKRAGAGVAQKAEHKNSISEQVVWIGFSYLGLPVSYLCNFREP